MADTVDIITLHNSATHLALRLLSKSDGTGESGVAKADKSTFTDVDGLEPAALDILHCSGIVFGANHVALNWDHTTDDEALILSGSFYFDFREWGPLKDPKSAGTTGDLLLTTSGMVANGGYCINLLLQKRPKNGSS